MFTVKYMKGEVVECIHSNINYMKENSKLCEYLVHMSKCVDNSPQYCDLEVVGSSQVTN